MTPALKVCLALTSCLVLTGCFEARRQAANRVYTQGPSLEVRTDQKTWAVATDLIEGHEDDVQRAMGLVGDDYDRRGVGPMLVVATAPNLDQAQTWGAILKETLVLTGVPLEQITVTAQLNGPAGATISYPAASAVTPPCGSNPFSQGTYLGCSIGHQVGQMVARPKDLYGNEGVGAYDSMTASGAINRQLRQRELAQTEGLIEYLNGLVVVQ